MKCPYCSNPDTRVIDSRLTDSNDSVRRRRMCEKCGKRFTTYERVEVIDLRVVKKDGSIEDFDREKIKNGIQLACEKREIFEEDIEKIVNAYRGYRAIEKYCRPVSLDEIRANDYNLNITRYIDMTEEEEPIDVQDVLDQLKELKRKRSGVEDKMNLYFKELGYTV